MNTITVLLSTYNGERYLEQQLRSIVGQTGCQPAIAVRDDDSTDRTCEILEEWHQRGHLSWCQGENVGPARSFLDLLTHAAPSRYYAFSDQDDYWQPEKLQTAISALEPYEDSPALYFCQTQLADAQLNPIESVIIHPLVTFGEALVWQFVGGCTMVMNHRLRDIVCQYEPQYLSMHDVWIYDVALAIGAKVIFDPVPHILYRQHGNNVTGQTTSRLAPWKDRLSRFGKGHFHSRSSVAAEIKQGFWHQMPADHQDLLGRYLRGKHHLLDRLRLLGDRHLQCGDAGTYRNFCIATLLNIY